MPMVPYTNSKHVTVMETDIATDLAVTPTGTIYIVSENAYLYTADANDGHVTSLGAVGGAGGCGTEVVALTFTPDGNLYGGDHSGAFCKIDISKSPPVASSVGTLTGGFALSGDLVAVGDGTMYGTATRSPDSAKPPVNVPATGGDYDVDAPARRCGHRHEGCRRRKVAPPLDATGRPHRRPPSSMLLSCQYRVGQ